MKNKKQHKLFTVVVLSLLVMIMFLGEQRFHERLRLSIFANNNIKELKKYTYRDDLKDQVSCIIPSDWEIKNVKLDNKSSGGLLQYDNFQSKGDGVYGYIKIWGKGNKLEELLHKDMEVCNMQGDIEEYNQEHIKLDKFQGYKVTYDMKTVYGSKFKVQEYFIKGQNKSIKFNFTKEEKEFKENDDIIFKTIVESIEEKSI